MTPQELATLIDKAGTIHELSWDNAERYPSYTKGWEECCKEVGMPEEWVDLVSPYLETGYAEIWDWVRRFSKVGVFGS
jgi:hypothetical protein